MGRTLRASNWPGSRSTWRARPRDTAGKPGADLRHGAGRVARRAGLAAAGHTSTWTTSWAARMSARTSDGDGTLSTSTGSDADSDSFVYNPADPVDTCGGATYLPGLFIGFNAGPRDQVRTEARQDVLCYTSEPLEKSLEVTGPVRASLHISSSAVDTDFTATLVDVSPAGPRRTGLRRNSALPLQSVDDLPEFLEPGASTRSKSTSSPPHSVSPPGTACGWMCQAATFPSLIAIPTRQFRWPMLAPLIWSSPPTPCGTAALVHPDWYFRSSEGRHDPRCRATKKERIVAKVVFAEILMVSSSP